MSIYNTGMTCNVCGDVVGDPLFVGCSCDDEMDEEEAAIEAERKLDERRAARDKRSDAATRAWGANPLGRK